ncbi:cell division protein FtsQ/DivIB [Curvivirga aplysinae]|uniref:cell division protein FtsQ/DivIB n=1 Tax=Curvivirga aplysinae TaxID=2529852 RepID=UPI0012BBF3DF|nr:cell division protein FtsQ/DivIB [Curvivirga aplysinae]MTI10777.1 FtsQ-type POTRA domain-containing protein [Curvivirga aplysinae]
MRSIKSTKKTTAKKTTSRKKAAPRRKKQASWKKPVFIGLTVATLLGLPAGGTAYLWSQGIIQDHIERVEKASLHASMQAGFVLDEVFVHGRKETSGADILAALAVERGQALINFDPEDARKRIEALGWIEKASVERKLPNNIVIRLTERIPVAIWQSGDRYVLVDKSGAEISTGDVGRYTHLKVLTGEDAPQHTLDLLRIIDQTPELQKRVIGAAWVGDRRWTLHLDNKVSVRLPAENPHQAWRKLAVMIQDHDLLSRDIELIDLRQPDRTIIRMTGSGAKRLLGSEENA